LPTYALVPSTTLFRSEELTIRNLGVIREATLPFGPGLTVLTGETGAGKTMVVTALGLLLGERSDAGALRRGGDAAVVEGHWVVEDRKSTRLNSSHVKS